MPQSLVIRGAREHNLKNIDLEIPRDKLVVITGLSGSGKSSLAFDTIYAEGQRRYVESLSAYARQFLEQMGKPDVDSIEGLSPAIAIGQSVPPRNPRSTVGTVTEIYDYLRVLFARLGQPHCWECGRPISSQTVEQIVDCLLSEHEGKRLNIFAPVVRGRKGEHKQELADLRRAGFVRVRIDGELFELDDCPALPKTAPHTIEVLVDRVAVRPGVEQRLSDSLEVAFKFGGEVVQVEEAGEGGQARLFSRRFACPVCNTSMPELTPRMFSFNSPYGACKVCDGLGVTLHFDPDLIVCDRGKSLAAGALRIPDSRVAARIKRVLPLIASHVGFSLTDPVSKLPEEALRLLFYGAEPRGEEAGGAREGAFPGIIRILEERYRKCETAWVREELDRLRAAKPCPQCRGARLRRESLFVRIGGRNISEVSDLSVREAREFVESLGFEGQRRSIAAPVLKEIGERLRFLADVGLDYLTLSRASSTLSGGEAERIRLATQIGSGLSGVLYILDEPSIGLHQRDNERLLGTLKRLRDLGNTVLVVEHDPETILAADWVIDMGPGAGRNGGFIVAQGTPADVMAREDSLTGRFLSGRESIPVPRHRRAGSGWWITLKGVRANNLKNLTVRFPLGRLTCVTGVSGSGKSSLVIDTLYRALAARLSGRGASQAALVEMSGWQLVDKVVNIDQAPIGRTPRSNPATYTGLFGPIRDLFAELPEAKVRGYGPGRFSFNVPGGRCEACRGEGMLRIEMHFLPDVYVTCDVCGGTRYARETLEVRFRGRSIADVLRLTVAEALELLGNFPAIRARLETLRDVGLDYVTLGQPATTLSGGEAQRVKLSRELSRRATGSTLYVLDEPTTGLHLEDVRKLLVVLERLVEQGNTVVVIEHNLEVIKTADYIIDLGPEGGEGGGKIVAEGSPEEVAAAEASFTGRYLRKVLAQTQGEARARAPLPC